MSVTVICYKLLDRAARNIFGGHHKKCIYSNCAIYSTFLVKSFVHLKNRGGNFFLSCYIVESIVWPLFRGTSFLKLPPLGKDAQDNIQVEMEIFPLERTGILLYNGWEPNKIGDFISLSIQDGLVELSYDCRSGPVKIR